MQERQEHEIVTTKGECDDQYKQFVGVSFEKGQVVQVKSDLRHPPILRPKSLLVDLMEHLLVKECGFIVHWVRNAMEHFEHKGVRCFGVELSTKVNPTKPELAMKSCEVTVVILDLHSHHILAETHCSLAAWQYLNEHLKRISA